MKKHFLQLRQILALIATLVLTLSTCTSVSAAETSTLKFSDINLQTSIPSDLVTFTRTTSANNSNLDMIDVSDIEELKSLMLTNNIYLEAVPEDLSYEIIINGKDTTESDLDSLSEEDLQTTFDEYVSACDNIDNSSVTETVTSSSIYQTEQATYFQLDVTSISNNNVTVYIRKYYTIKMGKAITFYVQTDEDQLTDEGINCILTIVDQSEYKTIKKSIWEYQAVSEIGTTLINILIPIGVLVLILLIVRHSTTKSQKQIDAETKRLQEKHRQEELAAKNKEEKN